MSFYELFDIVVYEAIKNQSLYSLVPPRLRPVCLSQWEQNVKQAQSLGPTLIFITKSQTLKINLKYMDPNNFCPNTEYGISLEHYVLIYVPV